MEIGLSMLSNLAVEGNKVAIFIDGKARVGMVSEKQGRKVLIRTPSGDEFWADERKLRTCCDLYE
jgi:hypothetical protein